MIVIGSEPNIHEGITVLISMIKINLMMRMWLK